MEDASKVKEILDSFLEENLNNGDTYTMFATQSDIGEFETDATSGEIFFTLKPANKIDDWMLGFVKNLGIKNYPGHFIFAILHEIGHVFTADDFDPELWDDDDYADELRWYAERKKELDPDSLDDCLEYFGMPDELAATEWAVNYCNDPKNESIIKKLKRDLSPFLDPSTI